MAFGSTGSALLVLDDLGEDGGEGVDRNGEDMTDELVSKLLDEGHDFSLMGSAKRLGAIRRAIFDQYRAKTRVRPRNASTATTLATIAVIRVVSKLAIVVYAGLTYAICIILYSIGGMREEWAAGEWIWMDTMCLWVFGNEQYYSRTFFSLQLLVGYCYSAHRHHHDADEESEAP
ncbi:hypothetical protein RRF57_003995 [Xylaria bambusicola]|uniref:Uncharacterized protein n=1 Tax=Xylaria bambusicola TaxID=326684 RepID=A0AAN7YWR7_9PEZI